MYKVAATFFGADYLTFLKCDRHMRTYMYIYAENRSLIQSLVLMHFAKIVMFLYIEKMGHTCLVESCEMLLNQLAETLCKSVNICMSLYLIVLVLCSVRKLKDVFINQLLPK